MAFHRDIKQISKENMFLVNCILKFREHRGVNQHIIVLMDPAAGTSELLGIWYDYSIGTIMFTVFINNI